MQQSKQCPKCAGAMAEGFVVDHTHGGVGVSGWVAGAPERSAWTGLKLKGRVRSDIAAWRCGRCGFLEHYAVAAPDRSYETEQRRQGVLVLGIVLTALAAVLAAVLILRGA
jgi:hypothetical protein